MAKAANPFMHYVADYEKEAEAFLTKYECADAIDNPRPIPIRDIATRLMSLEIIDTEYLSFDGSVQGAIAFTKGIIEVYDWSAEETIGYEVSQPSIFVDADIMNIGRFNNTLAMNAIIGGGIGITLITSETMKMGQSLHSAVTEEFQLPGA